jgi:hypothetical protein
MSWTGVLPTETGRFCTPEFRHTIRYCRGEVSRGDADVSVTGIKLYPAPYCGNIAYMFALSKHTRRSHGTNSNIGSWRPPSGSHGSCVTEVDRSNGAGVVQIGTGYRHPVQPACLRGREKPR